MAWRPSFKKSSNVEENENTALKEYIFVKNQYVEKLEKYHPPFLQITYSINGQTINVYNNEFFRKYIFLEVITVDNEPVIKVLPTISNGADGVDLLIPIYPIFLLPPFIEKPTGP